MASGWTDWGKTNHFILHGDAAPTRRRTCPFTGLPIWDVQSLCGLWMSRTHVFVGHPASKNCKRCAQKARRMDIDVSDSFLKVDRYGFPKKQIRPDESGLI